MGAIHVGPIVQQPGRSADHLHSVIEARAALGRVHLARGDFKRAVASFESGLASSRAWNLWDSSVFSGLGYAYALAGRVEEGLPLLQEVVERGHSIDAMGIGHAMRLSRLGEGYLLAGRLDEAHERAHEALEFSRRQAERANEAWALRVLGAIAVRRDPLDLEIAAEYYRQALVRAGELGMRPLVAHCHAGLGRLYRHTGKRDDAVQHLGTATAMFREMDMRFWLAQVERELKDPA